MKALEEEQLKATKRTIWMTKTMERYSAFHDPLSIYLIRTLSILKQSQNKYEEPKSKQRSMLKQKTLKSRGSRLTDIFLYDAIIKRHDYVFD